MFALAEGIVQAAETVEGWVSILDVVINNLGHGENRMPPGIPISSKASRKVKLSQETKMLGCSVKIMLHTSRTER